VKELIWDNTLSVQVQEVDDDHQKLVDLFNILNQSVEQGEPVNYIEAVLEELISCTVWHFRHEERLMLKYGYDDYEEHKAEHQELIDSARELQQTFLQAGKEISAEDITFLENWLTGHILGMDIKMGSYLAEVM
jgi:hemerythrin